MYLDALRTRTLPPPGCHRPGYDLRETRPFAAHLGSQESAINLQTVARLKDSISRFRKPQDSSAGVNLYHWKIQGINAVLQLGVLGAKLVHRPMCVERTFEMWNKHGEQGNGFLRKWLLLCPAVHTNTALKPAIKAPQRRSALMPKSLGAGKFVKNN